METKFTTDGKKVVVIGKLNSSDFIVQEVFVSNGNEIPGGENFVVKSLLDAPAESWKSYRQKEQERLDKEFEKTNENFKIKIRSLNKEYSKICGVVSAKINYMKALDKRLEHKSFDLLYDFISGKIKYLVTQTYSGYEIVGFNSTMSTNDDYDSTKIKLITLFGRSDGNLEYNLHTYSDGSGSGKTIIHPFKTKEDCISFISKKLDEKEKYSECDIKTMKKYGIKPDERKLAAFKEYRIEQINKRLIEAEGSYKKIKDELDNFTL